MNKSYRIIFQTYDKSNPDAILSESCVLEADVESPTNCLNFSMGMSKQIGSLIVCVEKQKWYNVEII